MAEKPTEATNLLKLAYGKLYNGKLAYRYGHAATDECTLCHLPDACTHIAEECKAHKNLTINRHNAACQLVHTAIRSVAIKVRWCSIHRDKPFSCGGKRWLSVTNNNGGRGIHHCPRTPTKERPPTSVSKHHRRRARTHHPGIAHETAPTY